MNDYGPRRPISVEVDEAVLDSFREMLRTYSKDLGRGASDTALLEAALVYVATDALQKPVDTISRIAAFVMEAEPEAFGEAGG